MTLIEQFVLLYVQFCRAAGAWGGSGRVGSHTALSRVVQSVFQHLPCVLEGYLHLSVEMVEDPFVGWLLFFEESQRITTVSASCILTAKLAGSTQN